MNTEKTSAVRSYLEKSLDYQTEAAIRYANGAIEEIKKLKERLQQSQPTSGNNYAGEVRALADAISRVEQLRQDIRVVVHEAES